ncbi:hypothetical protein C8P63_10141 [Melghirimyces profundicolus]|uniref:Uncharacterized protein n=1 Tax=Melghirimyces profundicolus TaxID=1242148 RepID=A0A2T6C942_9BACL|nr:hypothetical protein [Melghirimyces profundicolus]PTX64824.1 hypothetical protein C8P63_10141 [Melghirimyces profundicolus]
MSNHFTDVGFRVASEADLSPWIARALREGKPYPTPSGRYVHWSADGRSELWVQCNPAGEVTGVNPHFAGDGRLNVSLYRGTEPSGIPLEGSFYAWAAPEEDPDRPGLYPFLFDVPDYERVKSRIRFPETAVVQLTAFAHELHSFRDEASYHNFREEHGIQFEPESFVSSGLVLAENKKEEETESTAVITGRVLSAETLTGPGEVAFLHCLVRTRGGTVDMVADPALPDQQPEAGGILQGAFWLSGRIL